MPSGPDSRPRGIQWQIPPKRAAAIYFGTMVITAAVIIGVLFAIGKL